MESIPKVRRDRRRRRRLLAFLMSALAVGTLTSTALSLALFTSAASVAANGFSTGTIEIVANGSNETDPAYAPTPGTVTFAASTAMFPDDWVSGRVLVENVGNGALRYAMTSTSGGALAPALLVSVDVLANNVACPATVSASPLVDGVALSSLAGFGSTAIGQDPGDQPLAAGGRQTVCFYVHFDRNADNTYQGTSATATFRFVAEQTKNN